MIVGIGTDLCDVERIALALVRTGERFRERVFTEGERRRAQAASNEAEELARAFAVKEATFKVLGRGWPDDISHQEIELGPPNGGPRPVLLSGRAARWAEAAGITRLHAATSGNDSLVVAVVIGESDTP